MSKNKHRDRQENFLDEDLEGFLWIDKRGLNRVKRKNQKFAIRQIKGDYREGFADEDEINDFF